jgi:GH24 family phage-related lysozyme (muramidase)
MIRTWDDFSAELRRSEGEIAHMYLDTGGLVTVGVGNLLPNVAAAQQLPFVRRREGAPATAAEIAADFAAVQQQAKGKLASAYRPHTQLDLPGTAIDALLQQRLATFRSDLARRFPTFASFPMLAQFALVDMAFNLGTQGLLTKFPEFIRAVEAGDWSGAAAESDRRQVAASRNALLRGWLLAAGGREQGD